MRDASILSAKAVWDAHADGGLDAPVRKSTDVDAWAERRDAAGRTWVLDQ